MLDCIDTTRDPSRWRFRPMDDAAAGEVAAWRYPGAYALYDGKDLDAPTADVRPPGAVLEHLAAVDVEDRLVGFASLLVQGPEVEIAVGLRPDLTGRGLGLGFLLGVLSEVRRRHEDVMTFRLAVAAFNNRALSVYRRAGFRPDGTVRRTVGGEAREFIKMSRPALSAGRYGRFGLR